MSLLRLITFRKGELTPAQAFISAAGITDPTQQAAITQLVAALQSYGLWSKMTAIYPFVGGTASAHSYNLKNIAQYQITWNGTVTHNSNGITGDGSTSFGNTNLNAGSVLNTNDATISIYIRTDNSASIVDMCADASPGTPTIQVRLLGTTYFNVGSGTYTSLSATTSLGYYVATRTSSTQQRLFRNGTMLISGNTNSTGMPNGNIVIGKWWTSGYTSNRNYAFATVGSGLSDQNVSDLYTAVQAFQTTLGRQV